eukprot:jgi/Mesvir1/13686/Mv26076-RA.1
MLRPSHTPPPLTTHTPPSHILTGCNLFSQPSLYLPSFARNIFTGALRSHGMSGLPRVPSSPTSNLPFDHVAALFMSLTSCFLRRSPTIPPPKPPNPAPPVHLCRGNL